MVFHLTDAEFRILDILSDDGLRDLALELEIPVYEGMDPTSLPPPAPDRRTLANRCIEGLARKAAREGLPLSEYARTDVLRLHPAWRKALARQLGLDDDVDALIRSGTRVYRTYLRRRPDSHLPLLVPLLLPVLGRYLSQVD